MKRRSRRRRKLLAKAVRESGRFRTRVKPGKAYQRLNKVDTRKEIDDEELCCD